MKKILFALALFSVLITNVFAQEKKVAVVTFYIDKMINLSEFGPAGLAARTKLSEDSAFNLTPLLNEFHKQFFEVYAKQFPFQLVPEETVINNEQYKVFVPPMEGGTGLLKDIYHLPYPGYKVMLPVMGHGQERDVLKMFQTDGVMKVYIDFKLVKIGFGGMGVVKVEAYANFSLFDKNGDKIFSDKAWEKSKNMSPLVGGFPVMTPEKILPMCESAMAELMKELQDDMPKLIKKAAAKL